MCALLPTGIMASMYGKADASTAVQVSDTTQLNSCTTAGFTKKTGNAKAPPEKEQPALLLVFNHLRKRGTEIWDVEVVVRAHRANPMVARATAAVAAAVVTA